LAKDFLHYLCLGFPCDIHHWITCSSDTFFAHCIRVGTNSLVLQKAVPFQSLGNSNYTRETSISYSYSFRTCPWESLQLDSEWQYRSNLSKFRNRIMSNGYYNCVDCIWIESFQYFDFLQLEESYPNGCTAPVFANDTFHIASIQLADLARMDTNSWHSWSSSCQKGCTVPIASIMIENGSMLTSSSWITVPFQFLENSSRYYWRLLLLTFRYPPATVCG